MYFKEHFFYGKEINRDEIDEMGMEALQRYRPTRAPVHWERYAAFRQCPDPRIELQPFRILNTVNVTLLLLPDT